MSQRNGVLERSYPSLANTWQKLDLPGLLSFVVTEASANEVIEVRIDEEITTHEKGVPFPVNALKSKVEIRSTTTQDVTIKWGIGVEVKDMPRLMKLNQEGEAVPVEEEVNDVSKGLPDVSVPAASATKVLDADTDRRHIFICNPSSNLYSFRIGGAGTTSASSGYELQPGAAFPISSTAEIWAHNENPSAAQSVCFYQEEKTP